MFTLALSLMLASSSVTLSSLRSPVGEASSEPIFAQAPLRGLDESAAGAEESAATEQDGSATKTTEPPPITKDKDSR